MTGKLPRKLQLTVQAIEGETTLSYMSRLAAANFRSLLNFARDIAIPISDVRAGAVLAVRKLARLGGVDPKRLQFNSHETTERNWVRVRGQLFSSNMRRRTRIMVCPLCISDDVASGTASWHMSAYNRISWTVTPIRTCVVHSVALVEIAPDVGRDHRVDFTRVIRPHVLDTAALIDRASPRLPTTLETYVEERLAGTATTPWLDSLELHVAVRFSEAVGFCAEHGSSLAVRAATEEQRLHAGATGYDILTGGVPALHRFLENTCRNHKGPYKASNEPGRLLGNLYTIMTAQTRSPDYIPVRRAIADFVVANFPVGPGDTVLGFPVEERRLHSVTTAVQQHGLTFQPRIRKMLMAEAKPTRSCLPEGHFLFDADAANVVCQRELRLRPASTAAARLGVSPAQLITLRKAGLIQRDVDGSGPRRPFYGINDVDELWQRIEQRSVSVKSPPKKAYDIGHVVKATHVTIATVVELILDGRLEWVGRIGSKGGLDTVLVDIDEMKARTAPDSRRGLTTQQAARKLAVHEDAIKALIAAGFLAAEKKHRSLTTVRTLVISPEAIERFMKTYISAFRLAQSHKLNITAVIKKMTAQGIEPAPELASVPVTFYRISDL